MTLRFIQPFIDAIHGFSRHENTMVAAGIAYYLALSFFPLLLVLAAVLGYALKWTDAGQDAQTQVLETISDQASPELSNQVERALSAMSTEAPSGGSIGFAVLVFAAIAMFAQFDYAFDRIWSLPSDPNHGWLHWIGRLLLTRLKALIMLLGVGAFMLASTIASTVWSATEARIAEYVRIDPLIQALARVGIGLVLNMLAFTILYRFMPRRRVRFSHALAGGFVTAVLWEVGRQLLSVYLLRQNYPTAYGVIGSFLAIILWAYYATLVVLYGAEFVRALGGHGKATDPTTV
jgi:membrane protein